MPYTYDSLRKRVSLVVPQSLSIYALLRAAIIFSALGTSDAPIWTSTDIPISTIHNSPILIQYFNTTMQKLMLLKSSVGFPALLLLFVLQSLHALLDAWSSNGWRGLKFESFCCCSTTRNLLSASLTQSELGVFPHRIKIPNSWLLSFTCHCTNHKSCSRYSATMFHVKAVKLNYSVLYMSCIWTAIG